MLDPKEPVPCAAAYGISTIMTPGETGGMEIEINLSPEGALQTKKRLFLEPFLQIKLIKNYFSKPLVRRGGSKIWKIKPSRSKEDLKGS